MIVKCEYVLNNDCELWIFTRQRMNQLVRDGLDIFHWEGVVFILSQKVIHTRSTQPTHNTDMVKVLEVVNVLHYLVLILRVLPRHLLKNLYFDLRRLCIPVHSPYDLNGNVLTSRVIMSLNNLAKVPFSHDLNNLICKQTNKETILIISNKTFDILILQFVPIESPGWMIRWFEESSQLWCLP